jgi:hypothetical protein
MKAKPSAAISGRRHRNIMAQDAARRVIADERPLDIFPEFPCIGPCSRLGRCGGIILWPGRLEIPLFDKGVS